MTLASLDMKQRKLSPQPQRGFSMIEVLISLLLLAFGMLGVAAMQTAALKNNLSSLQRAQTSTLAYFLMDAMRANVAGAEGGYYNLGSINDDSSRVCSPPTSLTTPPEAALASSDLAVWFDVVRNAVGNSSDTCALVQCGATSVCTVRVFWNDERGLGGITTQSITIQSNL